MNDETENCSIPSGSTSAAAAMEASTSINDKAHQSKNSSDNEETSSFKSMDDNLSQADAASDDRAAEHDDNHHNDFDYDDDDDDDDDDQVILRDAFSLFIQKQKLELATELRRLQFSNRPVTGQTSRDALEQLFIENRNAGLTASQPVQSSEPTRFRSESMQAELNELNSRASVRTLLQTSGPSIERTLEQRLTRAMRSNNSSSARSTVSASVVPVSAPDNAPVIATPASETRIEHQRALITAIQEYSRTQVLGELGELVHRQLVSSTLESEFRRNLELTIVDRLRRTGQNDAEALARLNRIQQQRTPTHHQRRANESNLRDDNDWLGMPTARANVYKSSKELSELKAEVSELKSLLKLSFELQLDMQRSLRQEISALTHNTFTSTDSNRLILANTIANSNDGKCIICTEANVDTVFYKCGHMCACYKCSMTLMQSNLNCAVCRAPIEDIVRTYRCNFDDSTQNS